MKKKLFLGLLAAAAVSFTACQKDEVLSEVPQDNAIGFSTYVGRDAQTKAAVTDKTEMEKGTYPGFGVFAYFTGNNEYTNSAKPDFMHNQQVEYDSGWDYNPKKYWPGGGQKVSFFAYAPFNHSSLAVSANNISGDPKVTYTQPEAVADQIDLLYATPHKNKVAGDISFVFNHALSRVGIKVKTARDDYQISITQVTLTGKFNTKGSLNLNDGSFEVLTTATSGIAYTPACLPTYTNSTTDGLEVTTSANNGYMMIIPTNLSAEADKIKVDVSYSYQYKYDGTNWSTATSTTQSGYVKVNFEQGKAYTLVLTLDPLSPIAFSVDTVTGWNTDLNGNSNTTDDDIAVGN